MNHRSRPGRSADDYRALVTRLLLSANRGIPIVAFLEDVTQILLETARSGAVVVRLDEWTPTTRCRAIRSVITGFRFETERVPAAHSAMGDEPPQVILCRALLQGVRDAEAPCFSARGSLWTDDAQACPPLHLGKERPVDLREWAKAGSFRSLVLIPFSVANRPYGLLQLIHERADRFDEEDVRYLEDVAEALGLALTHHRVQWALQERVKELTCLYGIAQVAGRNDLPLPEILATIAALLPPGWQYPERCGARILLDGTSYATANFVESGQLQSAGIQVGGRSRGRVDVVYLGPQPEMHEGPYLVEERSLINEVSRQIALIVERRLADSERAQLHEQLLHADRLATLGKLTAGVAHELNEPLGSILGFAQLADRAQDLPEQTTRDLQKIVKASLHAREIIKKLMFFGRQTPPGIVPLDLNLVVEDALGFLEPQFAGQPVRLIRDFAPDLPPIMADPGQMQQVLVNLTVNAIQAMPEGGDLRIGTRFQDGLVLMFVEDTGLGMPEEVLRQLFVPFFTTKEVGQGTGLGLSVVHGIVTAHGGSIRVESRVGLGSRFEVRIPAASSDGRSRG